MKGITVKKLIIAGLIVCVLSVIAVVYLTYGVPHIYFDKKGIAEAGNISGEQNIEEKDAEYVSALKVMISNYFDGDVSDSQLNEGVLKGVFSNIDPYSAYFNKAEADLYFSDTKGKYCGVGLSIDKVGESIVISKVYTSSPADKAGLTPGDEIIKVNDENVLGMSTDEIAALIRGDAGTKVKLGIMKNSDIAVTYYELTRTVIGTEQLEYHIVKDIGYIKIDSFNSNTENNITSILNEFDKKNIKKVVLDLRNNPGGIAEQAVTLANRFIPKGLIATVHFKATDLKDTSYYSSLESCKYKFVVLVNGMTKSSAELFAGAVQDRNAGKLIGTKTFGKAKVQQTFGLLSPEASEKYEREFGVWFLAANDLYQKYHVIAKDDELIGYAKVTVGRYYTPKGRMIDQNGITPDVIVNDPSAVNGVNLLSVKKLTNKAELSLNDKGLDIYNAECILKMLGYGIDNTDAILDKKTAEFIRELQKNNGINPSGKLDNATQAKLNNELEKLIVKHDEQYQRALEILNN